MQPYIRRENWPGDLYSFALADPLKAAGDKLQSLRNTARDVEALSPSMANSLAMEIENAVDALARADALAFSLFLGEQFRDPPRPKRAKRSKAQASGVR